MPKIIADLENRILEEAKKQLNLNGVEGLKIRRIASEMNIAPGTIYNYYPSKEKLVSHIILKDWNTIYSGMRQEALSSKTVHECITTIASKYNQFTLQYSNILRNFQFSGQPSYELSERHSYLVKVLSDLLSDSLSQVGENPSSEVCWMISELLIAINKENKAYEPFLKYFEDLIKGDKNE